MKRLLIVLAAVLLAVSVSSCGSNGNSGGSAAAAVVNGSTITMDQLNAELELQAELQVAQASAQGGDELVAQARAGFEGATSTSYSQAFTADVMSQLIATQLLTDEAAARGLVPSSEDIAAAEQAVQQKYEGIEISPAAQETLVERYATVSALNAALAVDFPTPEVTDEAVRAAYDQSIDQLVEQNGDFACVDLILIGWSEDPAAATAAAPTAEQDADALTRADDVAGQLDAGGSFADLAGQYSSEPTTSANGGTYGCLPAGNFPIPEIESAAFSQEVGTVSDPIRSDYGYLILKVRSRGVPAFEDIEDDIRSQLEQQAASESTPINGWYQEKRTSQDDPIEVEVNPQIGSWTATGGVVPPEGASTQTTVGGDPTAGDLPIDLSQLTGQGG